MQNLFLCGYEAPTTFLEGYLTLPPSKSRSNSVDLLQQAENRHVGRSVGRKQNAP